MKKQINIQIIDKDRYVVDRIQELLVNEGWDIDYCEKHSDSYEYGLTRTIIIDNE